MAEEGRSAACRACPPSPALAVVSGALAPGYAESLRREAEGGLAADGAKLPRIAPAHAVVGRVTREVGALVGLREGTPVVAGGADFAAAALGSGVSRRAKSD